MVKQKGEPSTRRYVKRLCPKENNKNWDKHLPYVELSYNNSYRASLGLKMVLFEALYGKKVSNTFVLAPSWRKKGILV